MGLVRLVDGPEELENPIAFVTISLTDLSAIGANG
jgi:hypothetical protein